MKNPRTKTVVLIYVIAFELEDVNNRFQEVVGFCRMRKLLETTLEVQVGHGTISFLISKTLYKHFSFLSYLMITVAQTVYPNYYLNTLWHSPKDSSTGSHSAGLRSHTPILQGDRFSLLLFNCGELEVFAALELPLFSHGWVGGGRGVQHQRVG